MASQRKRVLPLKEPACLDVGDRQFGPAIDEPNLDTVDWEFEIQPQ